MRFAQLLVLAVLLGDSLEQTDTEAHRILTRDSVEAVTEIKNDLSFVGVDPLETRLTVTFVLVFILVIFALLLSIKIKHLDRMKGID